MMKFEVVSRFANAGLPIPSRSTKYSAGYDFVVAEDVCVPAYKDLRNALKSAVPTKAYSLEELAAITKATGIKPTLVSTGMKCQLDPDTYLELSVRSSTPLKHWLILANSKGIIDSDYYNNPDNEGEIFFQLINLSPFPINLRKGDRIGQGIIHRYFTVDDDAASGERLGGLGSTNG